MRARFGDPRDAYIASPKPLDRVLTELFGDNTALTIFDIGACEAEDSIRYATLFRHASVYAVEPLPTNLTRAHRLIARRGTGNVRLVQRAVSDVNGEADFHVSSGQPPGASRRADWDYGNKSSSLLQPHEHLSVHPWVRFDETIRVRTSTLDDLCRELRVDAIDFIHLDVQGAEMKVLAGAPRLLPTVRAIWLEVEAIELYRGQPLKSEVEEFLSSHGFAKRLDTVNEVSGDQLWVRLSSR